MDSSARRVVVFGVIVAMHAAAIVGLMHFKHSIARAPVQAPLFARAIPAEARLEHEPQRPIELKTLPLQIQVERPIEIEFDAPIPESPTRAITVPVQAFAPAVAQVDRSVPKLVESVEYMREPVPHYPPQSRRLREEGLVMLKVLIDERGVACSIEIATSSGFARLDRAARDAVLQATFRPYVEDGAPRRALVLIPIEFSLSRSSA